MKTANQTTAHSSPVEAAKAHAEKNVSVDTLQSPSEVETTAVNDRLQAACSQDSTSPPKLPAASSKTTSGEQGGRTTKQARDTSKSVPPRAAMPVKTSAASKPKINPQDSRYEGSFSNVKSPKENKDTSSSQAVSEPSPNAPPSISPSTSTAVTASQG